MTNPAFYSDRTVGPRVRDRETVPEVTWRGLVALVDSRVTSHWLAETFPGPCPDGRGVVRTDRQALFATMEALIPDLTWPPDLTEVPAVGIVMDLIDFVAQRVAKPVEGKYHSFYEHHELTFDAAVGRAEFRKDVDLLFARSGVAFQVGPDLRVIRLGHPEARPVLADLCPDTGDQVLDDLIVEARGRFLSRAPGDKRVGLEKLWDAFERLKTLEPGKGKKEQVRVLLDLVASGFMRKVLEDDAQALSAIGNEMQIRHWETTKTAPTDGQVDYLFTRMATFLVHLLRETGRLAV